MKVASSRRALRHLVHLRQHIEKDSEQSATLVASRILKAVGLLESHPEIGRTGRVVGTREARRARISLRHPIPGPGTAAGTNCSLPWTAEVAAQTVGLRVARRAASCKGRIGSYR